MIWFFIFGLIIYAMIGLLICGFLDISFDDDRSMFFGMVVFWPLFVEAFIIFIMVQTPIRVGKKLGDKYLSIIEDKVNRFLNN